MLSFKVNTNKKKPQPPPVQTSNSKKSGHSHQNHKNTPSTSDYHQKKQQKSDAPPSPLPPDLAVPLTPDEEQELTKLGVKFIEHKGKLFALCKQFRFGPDNMIDDAYLTMQSKRCLYSAFGEIQDEAMKYIQFYYYDAESNAKTAVDTLLEHNITLVEKEEMDKARDEGEPFKQQSEGKLPCKLFRYDDALYAEFKQISIKDKTTVDAVYLKANSISCLRNAFYELQNEAAKKYAQFYIYDAESKDVRPTPTLIKNHVQLASLQEKREIRYMITRPPRSENAFIPTAISKNTRSPSAEARICLNKLSSINESNTFDELFKLLNADENGVKKTIIEYMLNPFITSDSLILTAKFVKDKLQNELTNIKGELLNKVKAINLKQKDVCMLLGMYTYAFDDSMFYDELCKYEIADKADAMNQMAKNKKYLSEELVRRLKTDVETCAKTKGLTGAVQCAFLNAADEFNTPEPVSETVSETAPKTVAVPPKQCGIKLVIPAPKAAPQPAPKAVPTDEETVWNQHRLGKWTPGCRVVGITDGNLRVIVEEYHYFAVIDIPYKPNIITKFAEIRNSTERNVHVFYPKGNTRRNKINGALRDMGVKYICSYDSNESLQTFDTRNGKPH